MTRYVNSHESQYGTDRLAITRTSGCTWTSLANGADAASGGRVDPEPDTVHNLVARTEEVNPYTPGWAIDDAALAAARLGLHLDNMTGNGWAMLVADHDHGFYLLVQGDSDQFGNNTCSGAFDGDHCIGVHPDEDELGRWRIDDPICATFRYEDPAVIRRYAEKLATKVRYGRLTPQVPEEADMVKITKQGPWQVDFPVGTQIYDLAGKPVRKAAGNGVDRLSPCETKIGTVTYNVVQIVNAGVNQFMLVRSSAVTQRTPFLTASQSKSAVDAAVTGQKAANDAEVAALTTRITGIKGKVAANAADVAND